jgi:hypothetical protein
MYKTGFIAATTLAMLAGGAFAQSPATSAAPARSTAPASMPPTGQWSANTDDDHVSPNSPKRALPNQAAVAPPASPAPDRTATEAKPAR